MTPNRRTLLAATAGLLAGCAGLESGSTPTDRTETDPPDTTDGAEPTSTPSGGSRLEDLRVDNAGDDVPVDAGDVVGRSPLFVSCHMMGYNTDT